MNKKKCLKLTVSKRSFFFCFFTDQVYHPNNLKAHAKEVRIWVRIPTDRMYRRFAAYETCDHNPCV